MHYHRPQQNQYQQSNWSNNTAFNHPNEVSGSLVRSAPLPYSPTPPHGNYNKPFQQHGSHLKNINNTNKPNAQHHNHQSRGPGPIRRYRG
ncbi:hypothetical protein BGZ76_010199 [Entomortierella beljakovae]|nr:hypothetical protein BGZ76_010199 [Entomortierella beljakovae]